MPNLFSLRPVETYLCVPASTSGLTRKAIGARTFLRAGDAIDVIQFRFALDVETKDALGQRIFDFLARFTNAGESAARAHPAGRKNAKQFAAGNDVESRAFVGKQAQDGAIRVRFNRITNKVIEIAERRFQSTIVIENRAGAVDIKRRSKFLRELLEIDIFAMQAAVAVMKGMHTSTLHTLIWFRFPIVQSRQTN